MWSYPGRDRAPLVNGRYAVLFAVCAGASLVLLITGPDPDGRVRDRRRVLARAAVLLALGALLTLAPSRAAAILPTYAVLFVAVLPFFRARLRWVTLAAALSLLVGPAVALVGQAVAETSGDGGLGASLRRAARPPFRATRSPRGPGPSRIAHARRPEQRCPLIAGTPKPPRPEWSRGLPTGRGWVS